MCLLHRCLINTRILFPIQMRRVITSKNSIFQSSVWLQDICPTPFLLPFLLLSGLETDGCAESPVVRRRHGRPSSLAGFRLPPSATWVSAEILLVGPMIQLPSCALQAYITTLTDHMCQTLCWAAGS